eukprot:1005762-Alexandrium_andersonii.AAC.1
MCIRDRLRQIPGVRNTLADATPRQSALGPEPYPAAFTFVSRSIVPARGPGYYRELTRARPPPESGTMVLAT